MGMPYDEYWFGKPYRVRQYIMAEKHRQEQNNFNAWLQGAYFTAALSATVGNMFKKSSSDAFKYPDKPVDLFGESVEHETPIQVEEREYSEALAAKAWMEQMVQVGKNWGNKQGADDGEGHQY